MMKTVKVKLNVDMLHYKKGSILTLIGKKHSGEGIFLSPYFKYRIEDSKIDNCLEIISDNSVNKENIEIKQDVDIEQIKPKKRGRPKTKKD